MQIGLIRKVVQEKKIDAIVLYSVPTNGLQTIYWAKRYNIPVVFRSLDALNQLVPYPVLRQLTKMMERAVYSKADMVLTLTPWLSKYVTRLGVAPDKVSVLPLPVDIHRFFPTDDTGDLRKRWGFVPKDKIVLFMGTLFSFSGLAQLISKFQHVLKGIPEAKLLIVGDGAQRRDLETLVCSCGLQGRVVIIGFQPYEDMPRYINMADVCVNPFLLNKVTRDIFPGKTVQFLACGKPLINTALPGLQSMISGEKQGVVYVKDVDEMARMVVALLEMPQQRQRIGLNGLKYARMLHGCHTVARILESKLESLVGK